MIWRLVAHGYGSLTEIETRWNIADVAKAHSLINEQAKLDQGLISGNRPGANNRLGF